MNLVKIWQKFVHDHFKPVMLSCRCRWRWRPCAARAVCPLKPWWAQLGWLCPSMILLSCPDTSVSSAPSLSFHLSFPSPPSFPDHAFSTSAPEKQAAVDVCVHCTAASLNASSLLFFSVHDIHIASSTRTLTLHSHHQPVFHHFRNCVRFTSVQQNL